MKTITELIKAIQKGKLPEIKGDRILIYHHWLPKQELIDWLTHYEQEGK